MNIEVAVLKERVKNLQEKISSIEESIASIRGLYNDMHDDYKARQNMLNKLHKWQRMLPWAMIAVLGLVGVELKQSQPLSLSSKSNIVQKK